MSAETIDAGPPVTTLIVPDLQEAHLDTLARRLAWAYRVAGGLRLDGGLYADTPEAAACRLVLGRLEGRLEGRLAAAMARLGVNDHVVGGWTYQLGHDGAVGCFRAWGRVAGNPFERRPA